MLLACVYVVAPALIVTLVLVVTTMARGGVFTGDLLLGPAVGALPAVAAGVWLRRTGYQEPAAWASTAFLAGLAQAFGGVVSSVLIRDDSGVDVSVALEWMWLWIWLLPMVSTYVANQARKLIVPPTTSALGDTSLRLPFHTRYLGHPKGHTMRPLFRFERWNKGIQLATIELTGEQLELAVVSPGNLGPATLPDEGLYASVPYNQIRRCRTITLGPEVSASPWMVLRTGTQLWAVPGEAILLTTDEFERYIPVDNATLICQLIERRIRRAHLIEAGAQTLR